MKNFVVILFIGLFAGCFSQSQAGRDSLLSNKNAVQQDTATFASGCFWCVEAKFSQLKGVYQVVSGYTGGNVKNPSYAQVCSGNTGHAEACQIIYDPNQISFDELLEAFFLSHDPTQLNRQGNDVGTQYRSAIFYHNTKQKERANYYLHKLAEQKVYNSPVVTQLAAFTTFYKAEGYHQGYFDKNPNDMYCRMVIQPQMEKFKKIFKDKIK
ncbi:MAG: peptide-methionine (S)-S-oxide reductase MsrA [Sphingobacterium sp.]